MRSVAVKYAYSPHFFVKNVEKRVLKPNHCGSLSRKAISGLSGYRAAGHERSVIMVLNIQTKLDITILAHLTNPNGTKEI